MDIFFESLKLGVAPSIVVAVYLTINKFIESKKEEKQAKLNSSLVASFSKLNNFLDYFTKDIIDKESDKCVNAIRNAFERFENAIIKYAITTIINNNVDINKENIEENILHLVNSEYYNIYNTLLLYTTVNHNLTKYINITWKDEICNDLKEVIFNKTFTKEQKIYILNNKLNIKINDYATNILNHYKENDK